MVLGQTITIVNQSGKVVKTSKHLVNVFNEAKGAYNERKAELKALRRGEQETKGKELKARQRLEALNIEDDDVSSRRSSRRGSEDGRTIRRKPVPQRERAPIERGYSDSFYANDAPSSGRTRTKSHRPSALRFDINGSLERETREPRMDELTRRHTDDMQLHHRDRPATPTRSASLDDIDMDLAYGELPPPLPVRKYDDTIELREKMSSLQRLLDEGNCLQHSVASIIDNLQKNPDSLAAVALTLAEISNLASKMAPGALMSMKGAFPAIIALLASPEFAIAVGVGVGITVIAFGGYKIIKKIKAKQNQRRMLEDGMAYKVDDGAESPASETDELREIDKIELWRRGIAEVEAESLGTSVEGEFVTPLATKTLIEEGRLTEADFKSSTRKKSRKESKKGKVEASSKSKPKDGKKVKAKKEPSGLRMLFKSKTELTRA